METPGHARYLTFSCYRRLNLFNNPALRDAFALALAATQRRVAFDLYAWVVMPNHVHLLVKPDLPDVAVQRVLRSLKGPFSARVLARWRELSAPILVRIADARGRPHFWQPGGGYDRNIVSNNALYATIDYIHANPIRAGLVRLATDWAWSSARRYERLTDEGPVLSALAV